MRKTLVFGNGLGMAIHPQVFDLRTVMEKVWKSPTTLSDDERELIRSCLPDPTAEMPESEADLGKLQEVVDACAVLRTINVEGRHWLTEEGKRFPSAINSYAWEVSKLIYIESEKEENRPPKAFCDSLMSFLIKTSSHVATLNYDYLLAGIISSNANLKKMFKTGVSMRGSDFSREKLFRDDEDRQSWYLKLHGSPNYLVNESGKLVSATAVARPASIKESGLSPAVILTHAVHKTSAIRKFEILTTYWEFLERAIDESDEVVVFGYSGNDIHLNSIISLADEKPKRVIEWLGSGTKKDRESFWVEQLGRRTKLVQMENILKFRDW
jgi:hypothetical protein